MKNWIVIIIMLFSILALFTVAKYYNATKVVTPKSNKPISQHALTSLVNQWRYDNDLQPFSKNKFLCKLALERSVEIQDDLSHAKFLKRDLSKVYHADFGENLSFNLNEPNEVLKAWLASPTHKTNIANPIYTQTCIACTGNFCAQEFSTDF